MRPLLALLVAAALLAGCTKNDPAPPGEPIERASTPSTTPTREPPTTSTPPPTTTPPASTPPPTTTPPSQPSTTTVPPPKPADFHDEKTGWVVIEPGATEFVVKIPFQILAGAVNASAKAFVVAEAPNAGPAPVQGGVFNVTILDPEGKVADKGDFVAAGPGTPQASATLNETQIKRVGDHMAILRVAGLSAADTAGHKYTLVVDVKY